MKIDKFYQAASLEDAYQLLLETNKNMIIAGGAWLKLSVKNADTLIGLDFLNLNKVTETTEFIEIGANTTLRDLETNPLLQNHYSGILSNAISNIMSVQVRNIATIGGSVIGKFGFSDLIGSLLVMDAKLVFYKKGELSLEDYLNSNSKEKDILVKVLLPKRKATAYFKKVSITALDFAVLNIAVSKFEKKILIAVGARPGIAKLALEASKYLSNQNTISTLVIEEAVKIASKEYNFSKNNRASAEYRKNLAEVYIKRGLTEVSQYEG